MQLISNRFLPFSNRFKENRSKKAWFPTTPQSGQIKEGISRKTMKDGISNRFLQFKGRKIVISCGAGTN